jgi:hypothetical protein
MTQGFIESTVAAPKTRANVRSSLILSSFVWCKVQHDNPRSSKFHILKK